MKNILNSIIFIKKSQNKYLPNIYFSNLMLVSIFLKKYV